MVQGDGAEGGGDGLLSPAAGRNRRVVEAVLLRLGSMCPGSLSLGNGLCQGCLERMRLCLMGQQGLTC